MRVGALFGLERRQAQIERPIVLEHIPVGRGQRRMCLGISGIEPDRLLEVRHRLDQLLRGQQLVVGPALQIGVMGGGVFRLVPGLLRHFLPG